MNMYQERHESAYPYKNVEHLNYVEFQTNVMFPNYLDNKKNVDLMHYLQRNNGLSGIYESRVERIETPMYLSLLSSDLTASPKHRRSNKDASTLESVLIPPSNKEYVSNSAEDSLARMAGCSGIDAASGAVSYAAGMYSILRDSGEYIAPSQESQIIGTASITCQPYFPVPDAPGAMVDALTGVFENVSRTLTKITTYVRDVFGGIVDSVQKKMAVRSLLRNADRIIASYDAETAVAQSVDRQLVAQYLGSEYRGAHLAEALTCDVDTIIAREMKLQEELAKLDEVTVLCKVRSEDVISTVKEAVPRKSVTRMLRC